MSEVDGNYQDLSVHELDNASLGPTEEAQDTSQLNRVIVPMGTYFDPGNPAGASGSINMSLDEHPVVHGESYGADYERDSVSGLVDVHAAESANEVRDDDRPDDRAEWTKDDWKAQARAYELHTSGNLDTLIKRVEDFEAEQEEN